MGIQRYKVNLFENYEDGGDRDEDGEPIEEGYIDFEFIKNDDGNIYLRSEADPVIAKLEAENEMMRKLLFNQWRLASGYGLSADEHTKELFNQWLEQQLKEE